MEASVLSRRVLRTLQVSDGGFRGILEQTFMHVKLWGFAKDIYDSEREWKSTFNGTVLIIFQLR